MKVAPPDRGLSCHASGDQSAIDTLPLPKSDVVYWDAACPGFGVKVPKGRKVFAVLYRIGGAGSKLRGNRGQMASRSSCNQNPRPPSSCSLRDKPQNETRFVAAYVEDSRQQRYSVLN
jgi:hypothetical protein